VVRILK